MDLMMIAMLKAMMRGGNSGGGGNDKPSIAAGLYETGTNYGTMIASWDELVESGKIVVDNGVVYRGKAAPDNLPAVNEYGFYFDVPYNDGGIFDFVFHADGSFDVYNSGKQVGAVPAGSAVYSQNRADMTSVDNDVAIFTDEENMTLSGCPFSIYKAADYLGDLVLPDDGSIISIGECRWDDDYGDYVGNKAFSDCGSLTGIVIPNSVTTISYSAFYRGTSLNKVTFGENSKLTNIDAYAFYYTPITEVELPASVETIGEEAFSLCKSLASVTFGENSRLTSIGLRAFNGCEKLTDIKIPASVETIGDEAFKSCESLTSVTIFAEVPPELVNAPFSYCTSLAAIKVPASSVDAYKAADGWSDYADIIVAKD